jgi:hypothetical protein
MPVSNNQKCINDLMKFWEDTKHDVARVKRRAARIALKKLLNRSPARTGNYMRSHKVGILKTEGGRGIGKGAETKITSEMEKEIIAGGGLHPKMDQAKKQMLIQELYQKKSAYISRFQLEDDITIYNNIEYADRVEYLGWRDLFPEAKVHTPPYHVYGLTIQEMRQVIKMLPKLMVKGKIYK